MKSTSQETKIRIDNN